MRRLAALAVLVLLSACKREAPAPAVSPLASPAPSSPRAPPAEPPHPLYAPAPDWGEPDTPKVRKLFEARFAEVKRCYEAELQKHPDARGKLTLRFTIVESGALRYVTVAKTTFQRRDVPSCVVAVVRRWKTPFHPDEPVEVEYPFSFSPR
jgi:hypothetical protein